MKAETSHNLEEENVISYVFRTYTLSQVLCLSLRTKQLLNNFISAFSALVYFAGYHHMTYTYTPVSDMNHLLLALTCSIWGFKTPFPNQRMIYIYVYLYVQVYK